MFNRLQPSSIVKLIALFAVISIVGACTKGGQETAQAGKSDAEEKESARQARILKVVPVEEQTLNTELDLPGNLEAYQDVPLHAKVEGYISWIGVDRGSHVKKGEKLITITAPEVDAKIKEAYAKVSAASAAVDQAKSAYDGMISKQVEARAKLDADTLIMTRLQDAAKTPGAVAKNDVDQAQKTVDADQARVESLASEVHAAKHLVKSEFENLSAAKSVYASVQAMGAYLTIKAPFDGVITERDVHNGSIVAIENSRTGTPMLRIQSTNLLRLVVAVPEAAVSGIKIGEKIPFSVPAYVGKVFYGTIARPGYALDQTTRTMPVELNAWNTTGELEPGMFATVKWQVSRPYKTLFLPQSAVATDLKGSFAVRVKDGVTQRIPVTQGQTMGSLVEVIGDLHSGDQVALKATDEIKNGTRTEVKLADKSQIESAGKHSSAGGE